ncbi:P-loop containing nucleoside triphosphate hydrolase [Glarea lozoyensis ATCC 20868]|uniref:Structural maintenance of chromosomes protein n=1 Tax=Glarea lozoyensis (strain ATCC 20868 / MF5171) TaxID=1116229 RepID=S3DH58_GLAL2|nr:P-loop containing nucleoside triphosphate hydrolase [Glarea lozoyensis ATCC 20868]EPE25908.1 P-loop containing nucleoside triphosphate hydrolase [Glarea lozoyensis ATCC 20868]
MGKLVRLELFNFKSYKGHHILLFGDSYFTSIIGPNGSGKSNSMDAISFVLGIKSSHLRSAHLRDLVYRGRVLKTSKINDDGSAATPATNGHANGDAEGSDGESQSQKPARNDPKSAWVMAVYEDDAGDEQKWKRTITNQGASEYRINDRIVTAQGYNEALEAENILIKARNFLVFQGDVEQIASQSPKDLTRLIEMVSGSLEHKAEYERLQEEAEQAAENQNYNLHRRRGINSEIKQYQEQKKEAEAFQNKQDERDHAIVQHILWKLYHFQRVMDESSASIGEHQENLKEFRRGVEKYEKQLEDARQAALKVTKDVSKVERNIKRKEKEIEEKENSLVPIDEKADYTNSQIEKLRRRLTALTKERDENHTKMQDLKKQLVTVEKAQKQFQTQWEESLKKQGRQLNEDDLKEYNILRSQVITKTSSNQSQLDNLIRTMKTDEVTYNSLKGKVELHQSSVEKLQAEIKSIEERKGATKSSVKEISGEIDTKKKEFNNIQSERVRVNQARTELDEKLHEVLKTLHEATAGQRQSDKETRTRETLVSLKRIFPGVKGRVGELCKPKQKKYDEAVITALGRDFDSVVVETEKIGQECVQYLKDQRSPPMTFIPLDNIKVTAVESNLKNLSKARLTIDTIDFDSSLERAFSYVCGSSIVCDDLPTAKEICHKRKIQVKAVTLQGYIIHKAGSMTGGRGPEGGKKRKFEDQDVENLRKQQQKLQTQIEALPNVSRRGSAEETLQNDLNGLEQRLSYAKSELAAFEQNLASRRKELTHEKRQLAEMEPKYREKESELASIREKVEEFQSAVAKVEDSIFKKFCERLGYSDVRRYEAQQGTLEQEAAEKKNEFEVQKKRLDQALSWETARWREVDGRVKKMEAQISTWLQDIESYNAEKAELENAIDVDRAHQTEMEDELQKQKEKLLSKNEKVNAARNELHKRSKEIDNRTKAITALETELQRNSAGRYALLRRCRLEQITIPLTPESKKLDSLPVDENLLQTDPDEMDVDEEEGTVETAGPDDDDVEEQLQQKIADLNSELEKLNPNMRAVDRLDGVEARLKSTEKDFEDARKKAKQSRDQFNEVKEKRFELFNKAFTHISEQISHVYKDLTRSAAYPLGGQAYLDTEDGDSPYLSGIKYHAMPPLKRFRDMEHLSGGEKTMAALALLFAVHSYQPSPFFVLDEVDAALDNANVEKIKNYIREHAGPGMQFIVISLKTGLFQGSESLVGVFRDQEANSSKTLTLDLRKYV